MENKKYEYKKKSSGTIIKSNKKKINNIITFIEFEKIKIILDFLFYDTTNYYASYKRFKQCFFFLNHNINLFSIFKEIVGENHKYITAPRFIKMFILFKTKKNNLSQELQHFFSLIILSLIKDWKVDMAGICVNCPTFSSMINFSENKRISNITILKKDELNYNIYGIKLQYDNNFECKLFSDNLNLIKCLEISLDFLDNLKEYDGITHVFGCYNEKINLLGFKCRSGIIKYFGEKIGTPFLFGDFGKELNCLKIKIDKEKGLIMIQTSFKENNNLNNNISELNNIYKNENLLKMEDFLIFEEKYFNETNPMSDDIIKLNLSNDFYKNENINDINLNYNNLHNIDFNIKEDDNKYNITKENILKEVELLNINNKNIKRVNSKNNIKGIYQKVQINSKQPKIGIKNITFEKVIKDKKLLEQIMKILEKHIKNEIKNEKLNYESDNNNIYNKYLSDNHILLPVQKSKKNFNDYSEFKQVEKYFMSLIEKNGDQQVEKPSLIYRAKRPKLKLDYQKINSYWKKFSEKVNIINKINSFFTLLSIIKLIKILSFLDNSNYSANTSFDLKQKIIIYKILQKNITKTSIFSNNANSSNTNSNSKNIVDDNKKLFFNNDDFEKYDMSEVKIKLKLIKDIISDNNDLYTKLLPLFNKYIVIYKLLKNKKNNEKENRLLSSYEQLKEIKNEIENTKKNRREEDLLSLNKTKYKLANKNSIFTISSGVIINNLDEIIDIDDANIRIYKKQNFMQSNLNNNEHYIDDLFPPSKTLFGINKNNNINIGKIEDILNSENKTDVYSVLPEKEEYNMNKIIIKKGLWKNYYFLDVIYSLLKYPSIIYKLFPSVTRTKNGLYGVYLRINGIWKMVIIDDYMPYLVDQQYNKLFSYSSLNQPFIWINLLEKAYTKLCGGYDKIQYGEVPEILDILTDTCTEKYDLISFNKLYLISKLKQDININKYLVFAKTNKNTSSNIGLLPDGNYLIEEIKLFKNGEINEYVLKLKNNFSNIIYNGEWGRESKKWIPALKNEEPRNDFEFYISLEELVNYFSVLYISKIHPIENDNEYFSEYIHYSKNEINFPNIAIIDISKDTNIIIQFHQKNPKFCNFNIFSIISYMIITDIDCEYIDSISSIESNYSIELNLKKGKYFLITDIIYRYITSMDNFHGYTINTYSKEKINILKNNENNLNLNLNHKEIITNAVINYSNKNLAPKRDEFDLDIYEQNLKNKNKFPFLFILFDNSSSDFDKNINIKINNLNDLASKNYAYYLDFENLNNLKKNEDEINDTLLQKESKLIMVLKLKEEFNFKINYHISPKITEEQLIEYTKLYGVDEELDEDGKIIQYLIEYDDGFIVLIENNYNNELFKMKLIMTGLICFNINTEQENIIYFDLNGKEIKLFKLKNKDKNNPGIVSFQFQFAD